MRVAVIAFSAIGAMGCADAEYLCLEPLGLSKMIYNFEHSIRGIFLDTVSLSFRGNNRVEMSTNGKGYYTEAKSYVMGRKTMRGGS